MDNTARKIFTIYGDIPGLFTGQVVDVNKDELSVEDSGGYRLSSMLAASCLIAPGIGDRVLVARLPEGQIYVLAVLEKAGEVANRLEFKGDVEINASEGSLRLNARDGITMGSPKAVELVAGALGLTAAECEMAFSKLSVLSETVNANLSRIKLFAEKCNSMVNRAVEKYQSRAVKVDGLDQISAKSIKQTASQLLSLSAKFTSMRADKNVKIDGKQIFMG